MRRVLLSLISLALVLVVVEAGLRMADVVQYRPLPPAEGDETRRSASILARWGRGR